MLRKGVCESTTCNESSGALSSLSAWSPLVQVRTIAVPVPVLATLGTFSSRQLSGGSIKQSSGRLSCLIFFDVHPQP